MFKKKRASRKKETKKEKVHDLLLNLNNILDEQSFKYSFDIEYCKL